MPRERLCIRFDLRVDLNCNDSDKVNYLYVIEGDWEPGEGDQKDTLTFTSEQGRQLRYFSEVVGLREG